MHPKYLGLQIDWPVFVKIPFSAGRFDYKRGDLFPWAELGVEEKVVANLYKNGYLYHSEELEREHEVGYRLSEFNIVELRKVREQLNMRVKERTDSKEQYNKIRCRGSSSMHKQRGLIRRFLYNNPSFEEDYYEIFESIKSLRSKPIQQESPQEA